MKILYAIQGTGNGHLSRARDIIPILQKKGELDILVSGIQADVELPFDIRYRFNGLSFIFGKRGGISMTATYRKSDLKRLAREIESLPIHEYDLILNDFEPVSAWACKLAGKPCIGLSHQAAVISKASPKPSGKDPVGKAILHRYAPVSASYGFHFERYDENTFTPVIRSQIREAVPTDKGHYTVYLPSYSDKRIIKVLSEVEDVKWQVFSKHSKKPYTAGNIDIKPVNNEAFIESFVSSTGVLCGAGFEAPAEALFLKKKLMVIPMKGQYEQQCNAAAAAQLGVPVIKKLRKRYLDTILDWVESEQTITVDYPDNTEQIINEILVKHYPEPPAEGPLVQASYKLLKKQLLDKLIRKITT
ncbi:MAG: glycosyltransferase family protein [Bacteroidota bacterium]